MHGTLSLSPDTVYGAAPFAPLPTQSIEIFQGKEPTFGLESKPVLALRCNQKDFMTILVEEKQRHVLGEETPNIFVILMIIQLRSNVNFLAN